MADHSNAGLSKIDGVKIVPLRQIIDERGKIMHMMKATDPHFIKFGEIYFSCAWPGTVKAWHIHTSMTINNAVLSGRAKLVMYDMREGSSTKGELQEVFFGNSGSEANEGALKLVRLYGHQHGEPEAQTLVMERAWHGRTLATLAATGSEKARKGFDPLPSGFIRIPYNDITAAERAAAADPRVRAPVRRRQGESRIRSISRSRPGISPFTGVRELSDG